MNTTPFFLSDDSMKGTIIASKQFFEESAVLAAFGKYTPSHYISIQPEGISDVKITVEHKAGDALSLDTLKAMMNELIDQQIRVDLEKHFGEMRHTIVKHAFAPVEL